MNKVLAKIPIGVFTAVLMAVSALASVYTGSSSAAVLVSYGLSPVAATVIYVLLIGVAYGFIARLLIRVVYAIGDRIFFRMMHAVPDYNLRRLPVAYNDFVRFAAFWLIVAKLFEALFVCLLNYLVPVGFYLWEFCASLTTFACLVAAYLTMDHSFVPPWQSGKCFVALAIPTIVLFAISVIW